MEITLVHIPLSSQPQLFFSLFILLWSECFFLTCSMCTSLLPNNGVPELEESQVLRSVQIFGSQQWAGQGIHIDNEQSAAHSIIYNPYYLIFESLSLSSVFFPPSCKLLWIGREVWLLRFLQGNYEGVLELTIAELLIFSSRPVFGKLLLYLRPFK